MAFRIWIDLGVQGCCNACRTDVHWPKPDNFSLPGFGPIRMAMSKHIDIITMSIPIGWTYLGGHCQQQPQIDRHCFDCQYNYLGHHHHGDHQVHVLLNVEVASSGLTGLAQIQLQG